MEKIFKNAESRKFLVTGASGFIGKAVVNYIMNVGGSVVAADFRIAPELESINNERLTLWKIDLTSEFDFPAGVTDVIHAAGRVADWGSYHEANSTY